MKKINLFLLILAAAAGVTNCSKADLVENKETGIGGTIVYATTDASTKTILSDDDDYKVLWFDNDQIMFISDATPAKKYTFTLSTGSGTTSGTFTCDQTPDDGTYTVYYPATYNGTNWPAQTYVNATDISGAPMKATATVSDGNVSDISFKNEGGILRYTVKGTQTITAINLKSGSNLNVTLGCGNAGVGLTTGGTVFNIAVPAGEYSNATLTFIATDESKAKKTADTFKVTKNKVSLATFESSNLSFVPFAFVDLGLTNSSGKKVLWAECNLGANNPEDPGNYYMWGATALMYSSVYTNTNSKTAFRFVTTNPYGDKYQNTWDASEGFIWNNTLFTKGVFNSSDNKKVFTKYTTSADYTFGDSPDSNYTLVSDDDAATAKNSSWCMPTKDDFVALAANCVWIWTTNYNDIGTGYIVYKAKSNDDKGKANMNGTWKIWDDESNSYKTDGASEATGYDTSDDHIFLPLTGFSNGKIIGATTGGQYWSRSLDTSDNYKACYFLIGALSIANTVQERRCGLAIRPIKVIADN